ncbi:MAG: hypothetical protein MUC49_19180 [Raineya sp.]|nr:hypothetical protein [Raineya sp.]
MEQENILIGDFIQRLTKKYENFEAKLTANTKYDPVIRDTIAKLDTYLILEFKSNSTKVKSEEKKEMYPKIKKTLQKDDIFLENSKKGLLIIYPNDKNENITKSYFSIYSEKFNQEPLTFNQEPLIFNNEEEFIDNWLKKEVGLDDENFLELINILLDLYAKNAQEEQNGVVVKEGINGLEIKQYSSSLELSEILKEMSKQINVILKQKRELKEEQNKKIEEEKKQGLSLKRKF